MKKLLFLAIALSLMSTTVMARWYNGTINEVWQNSDGTIRIVAELVLDDGSLYNMSRLVDPASTYKKEILAIALTAATADSKVKLDYVGTNWVGIATVSGF